jgi:TRAP-type C4-dicarboxylate transport system permease small subunit
MKIENMVIVSSLSGMFVSILLQVIMRYIFGKPLLWSEEVARYLFVYFSLIGISYAIRENCHIRMVAVVNLLPAKVQTIISIVINLILAVLFLWIAPQSIPFLKTQMAINATATEIPMFFVYIVLPIGFIMSGIRLILKSIEDIKTLQDNGGV